MRRSCSGYTILIILVAAFLLILITSSPTWKFGMFEEPYTKSIFLCILDHCIAVP